MRIITEMLGELAALQRLSLRTGIPASELLERRLERRDFLRKAGMAGIAVAAGPSLLAACTSSSETPAEGSAAKDGPRVVVVGAGLAGMTAAYRLNKAGLRPAVYEGSERVGGRTNTVRDAFSDGQTVEACGEYINSDHTAMRNLAIELGLELDNLWSYYDWSFGGLTWIDGGPYDRQDALRDFQDVYPALHRDTQAAGWPTTYDHHTEAGVALDNMTLAEWIDENVPGGRRSRFGKLIEVGYTGEYGLDAEDQSALNLMFEMGYSPKNKLRLYGDQDWKWRVKGGNDLVATTVADQLPEGCVNLDHRLAAIRRNSDDTYTLSFEPADGGAVTEVRADRVILTIPFTTMRFVDYSKAGFDELKDKAIRDLGMGTNSKLHLQFTRRPWEAVGYSGDATTDLPFQETTIVYPAPRYEGGILDIYTGGSGGAQYGSAEALGPAPEAVARQTLKQLETVFPGISKAWNGRSHLHYCIADRWMLGSYSCPVPGEYTSIYGSEKLPQGGVHFAGEHTSIDWIGFMNGAVESGERAASEVMKAVGS